MTARARHAAWRMLLAAVAATLLAVAPAHAAPSKDPCKAQASKCAKDAQCCAGLVCQTGACLAGCRIGGTFRASGALNPANACQSCQPSLSTTAWTNVTNGTACSDGNACTQTDVCQSGACVGGNAVTCTASDQCHDAGTCNRSTGVCSNPAKPNGSACDDGDACTPGDTCQAGACSPGTPVTCTAQGACHDAGTCDPATGQCSNPSKADGAACDDGQGCTINDACLFGQCIGSLKFCVADQCHQAAACDPSTGSCPDVPKADGTPCNDGDACTTGDRCEAGVCSGAGHASCDAPPGQCQDAPSCDSGTGQCVYPPKPDGTACDDGDACTNGDSCQGGACTGGSLTFCVAPDQCHDAGTCDTATGVCSHPAKPNGTACSDGDACTTIDTCQAGVCTGSTPVLCIGSASTCLQAPSCDPATGRCVALPKPNGTACSDSNQCTTGDACQNGSCQPTGNVICPAPTDSCQGNPTCNIGTGSCVYPTAPDGAACDDRNPCTLDDRCQGGACQPGDEFVCPPTAADQCHQTINDCNPANGQCVPRYVVNGTACDDGNACTSSDACQSGACTGDPCGPGTCCVAGEGCVDVGSNRLNCGACGNTCPNGGCRLGQCYDGCVVAGVGYANGVRNPANDCEICDVAANPTGWTGLNSILSGTPPTVFSCTQGCASGICQFGMCSLTAQTGGCPSTTCSQNRCEDGVCVGQAINDGGACTPPISANPCKATSGTCQGGICVAPNANEGGYCRITDPGPPRNEDDFCRSTVDGACRSGTCTANPMPDGSPCYDELNRCWVGTCTGGMCPRVTLNECRVPSACGAAGTCDPTTGDCNYPGPFPSFGELLCGGGPFKRPELCCPGQECMCPPTPTGLPNYCQLYGCWNPDDIPDPTLIE